MNTNSFLIPALIFSLLSNSPISVLAQIDTTCSPTMLSTATGCIRSPTSDCCGALRSLAITDMGCLCQIVYKEYDLPFNKNLGKSLACVPALRVQCKATAAPLPALGLASFGTAMSPTDSPTPDSEGPAFFGPTTSPKDSQNPEDEEYPGSDDRGDRKGLAPPPSASLASSSSDSLKLLLLLFAFAFEIIKFF